MKKYLLFLIILIIPLVYAETPSVLIDINNLSQLNNDLNFSTFNVNNSQYLNGFNSSYFYQYSNPNNFVNYSNFNSSQFNLNLGLITLDLTWLKNLIDSIILSYNYITINVNNLVNYYLKNETYNKTEIDLNISNAIISLDNSTIARTNMQNNFTKNQSFQSVVINGTITGPINPNLGYVSNGTCIFIGNLSRIP